MIKIINDDCLNYMKTMEDKSIDLILCDLPYGVTKCKWDKKIDLDKLWEQYERIIKDNGVICLFGQNKFFHELINSNEKLYRYDLVWDKVLTSDFFNSNRKPLRRHEQIAVFYKNTGKYNSQVRTIKADYNREDYENAKGSVYSKHKKIKAYIKLDDTKYPTSILRYKKVNGSQMMYATEKPIELLEYLIKLYTDENDVVLDNCMGSCTTGVACNNTHRNFIGIEINRDTFEIAKLRLEKENINYDE